MCLTICVQGDDPDKWPLYLESHTMALATAFHLTDVPFEQDPGGSFLLMTPALWDLYSVWEGRECDSRAHYVTPLLYTWLTINGLQYKVHPKWNVILLGAKEIAAYQDWLLV